MLHSPPLNHGVLARSAAITLAVALAGCRHPPPANPTIIPDTAEDPEAFRPPAAALGEVGVAGPLGLYVAPHEAMAKAMVRNFVEAVAARAQGDLVAMMDERMGIFEQRGARTIPRQQLALWILSGAPTSAGTRAEAFLDLPELQVRRVEELGAPPTGYLADDLVVRVPLTAQGRELFARVRQFWQTQLTLVVRVAEDGPLLVAL